jgi:spoIIIJ-associated protein
VEGGNSAVLIGRHGQTLEAIQSLIEKVVNKNNHHRIRVRVDVGGYLQNRKKRLIRNAERLAQKCRRTKKPVTAGLLNAHDRRVVHLALKDTPSVRTRSTGDGPLRNLMILPSKSANGGQRKRQRRDS